MERKISLLNILLIAFLNSISFAQSNSITVIASGSGESEKKAINEALRSCIEKTMGVFISSSTTIENDELISDQISTVASGNIKDFKVINSVKSNERYEVIVSAIITPEKLVTQLNKSGENKFEVKGNVFTQNVEKERFYATQELLIVRDFLTKYKGTNFSSLEVVNVGTPRKIDWNATSNFHYNSFEEKNNKFNVGTEYKVKKNSILIYNGSYSYDAPYIPKNKSFKGVYEIPVSLILKRNENLDQFETALKNLYESIKIQDLASYKEVAGEPFYSPEKRTWTFSLLRHITGGNTYYNDNRWYFRNEGTFNLIVDFYFNEIFTCFDLKTAVTGDFVQNNYEYFASQGVMTASSSSNWEFSGPSEPNVILSYNFGKNLVQSFPIALSILLTEEQLAKIQQLEFNSIDQKTMQKQSSNSSQKTKSNEEKKADFFNQR